MNGNSISGILNFLLKDQSGVSQIIVNIGGMALFITVLLFGLMMAKYVMTYNELKDIGETIMRDAMKVNNGLTPSVQMYIRDELVRKGFDSSRLSITGTPSPQSFGTEMTGQITYVYQFPVFQAAASLFPDIQIQNQTMSTRVHVYSLGVIR